MTAYAAQADIQNRYGSNLLLTIADPDGTGAVNTGVVSAALSDASDTIDSHLQERYQLPLVTVPDLIVGFAVDIAVYRMATLPTDEMRNRYKDVMQQLKNISTGIQQLGLAPPPPTEGQSVVISGPHRTFGRNKVRPV